MSASELIKGYNKKEAATVFVAVCTDCKYLAPALVAIRSVAMHASEDLDYVIYVLSEKPLGIIAKRALRASGETASNIRVEFLVASSSLGNVNLSASGPIKGVTRATYLRFLLPEMLPDLKKVLYLDVDTVALGDVSRIYSESVDGFYLGGVKDVSGHANAEQRCAELGIGSLNEYVNAGVLLMNLELMRQDGASEKMLDLASKRSFPYNDQDVINSFCYGKIKILEYRFNAIVDFLDNPGEVSFALGIDYEKEASDAVILHYSGRTKPWYHPKHPLSLHWWETARSFGGFSAFLFKIYQKRLFTNKKV